MPSYKCSRFNRSANVPNRMCQCGQRVIPISKKSGWLCPEHGIVAKPQLCDCDGCQKSFAIRFNSDLKKRPWNIKGHSMERPNRSQYLLDIWKHDIMRDIDGLPHHICPKCKNIENCVEPFKIKPHCNETFTSKDAYVHCPVNFALDNNTKEFQNVIRRACGGFWPSNPLTKDEELKEHIFYFHDASRQAFLMKESKLEITPEKHKCSYIQHICSKCRYTWISNGQDRFLRKRPIYKDKFYLGTTTAVLEFKNSKQGREDN